MQAEITPKKNKLRKLWEYLNGEYSGKFVPEFEEPFDTFSTWELMTTAFTLLFYSSFLALPVAYLSAYPNVIPYFIGSTIADVCYKTGQCDFHVLMGATGLSIYLLTTVLFMILVSTNPKEHKTPDVDHFENLSEQIAQLYDLIEKQGGENAKPK